MATDRENRVAGTDQYERDSSVSASLVHPSLALSRYLSRSLAREFGSCLSLFLSFLWCAHETPSSLGTIPRESPPAFAYAPFRARKHTRTHARTHTRRNAATLSPCCRKRIRSREEKGEGKWRSCGRWWEWSGGRVRVEKERTMKARRKQRVRMRMCHETR